MKNDCVVIPCSGPKLTVKAKASEMYISHVFKRALVLAKKCDADLYIFSAKYGLITLDTMINPYELTLWHNNTMKAAFKQKGVPLPPLADSDEVAKLKLEANEVLSRYTNRVYLMSRKYCEDLVEGYKPMYNMVFIKQQGFMKNATPQDLGLNAI